MSCEVIFFINSQHLASLQPMVQQYRPYENMCNYSAMCLANWPCYTEFSVNSFSVHFCKHLVVLKNTKHRSQSQRAVSYLRHT